MKPPKINAPSPLAVEYLKKKKQDVQEKKIASSQKRANTVPPGDVVTLSSEKPGQQNLSSKTKQSQPVTPEEKQALKTVFSIHA